MSLFALATLTKQTEKSTMSRNPYRKRKSQKLLKGCLLVAFSFIFVATNVFLTMWLPPIDVSRRSLIRLNNHYEYGEKKNEIEQENDVLHIVTSRFMQSQSTLNALAKARLRLFETFCLPTMLFQEADNFLWFVMTDPELAPELLRRLKSLLEARSNFYLVASNAKLLTPSDLTKILSADQRDSTGDTAYRKLLMTGDIELLKNKMFDSHTPLLLETRLDADDGLRFDALSQIQTIAKGLPVDTRGWQIICNNVHYEWRNDDVLTIDSNITKTVSSGKLRIVRESICVTPGYTLVRHREPPSTEFPPWPKLGHNLVAREWPECRITNESIVEELLESNDGNATFDCWKKMGYFPSALRSRTATSAGMSRIETQSKKSNKFENLTEMFWTLVHRDFHIEPENARSTSQYMKDNLHSIVYDNLKGQW